MYIVVKRVQSAIESLLMCSDKNIVKENVVARLRRMNSPYLSRRQIKYNYFNARAIDRGILFYNVNYALYISHETYTEGHLPDLRNIAEAEDDFIVTPFVQEMAEWRVPKDMVIPLLEIAEKVGFNPHFNAMGNLVKVAVNRNKLYGYHYEKPIWGLNAGKRKITEMMEVEAEVVEEQGSLKVIKDEDGLGSRLIELCDGAKIYNHVVGSYEGMYIPELFAVMINGTLSIAGRVCSDEPIKICCYDHNPIVLDPDRYILAHSLKND